MSQAVLAERLGISPAAVNKLEHAEIHGGVTTAKLGEVAAALDCVLVYTIVPRSSLEETVQTQAHVVAAEVLGYAARTMALEAQEIEGDRQQETIERYAHELVTKGNVWRAAPGRRQT